jgi:hypothetical protein
MKFDMKIPPLESGPQQGKSNSGNTVTNKKSREYDNDDAITHDPMRMSDDVIGFDKCNFQ